MPMPYPSDAELLSATDTRSFELFYRRNFEALLGFFARRTRDPELAADLTAETFAAALSSPALPPRAGRGRLVAVLDRLPQARRRAAPRRRREPGAPEAGDGAHRAHRGRPDADRAGSG